MQPTDLQPANDALRAIRTMAKRLIGTNGSTSIVKPTRLELAFNIHRMQHGEFVHWMRCEAADDALQVVIDSIEVTLGLLKDPPDALSRALTFCEPYRHLIQPRVVAIALREAERASVEKEMAKWRGLRSVSADEPVMV